MAISQKNFCANTFYFLRCELRVVTHFSLSFLLGVSNDIVKQKKKSGVSMCQASLISLLYLTTEHLQIKKNKNRRLLTKKIINAQENE